MLIAFAVVGAFILGGFAGFGLASVAHEPEEQSLERRRQDHRNAQIYGTTKLR